MPPTPPYAELHCHSAYSLLDGASLPEELAYRAADLGYGALALTDHDSLAGAMELAIAARACSVHAILGAELTVRVPGAGEGAGGTGEGAIARHGPVVGRRPTGREPAAGRAQEGLCHLTLLVRDGSGWSNLCRLVTHAHAHTRAGAARRASQAHVSLEQVLTHAEGLVCLTGCARQGMRGEHAVRALREAFGTERLRVELQRPYLYGDRARNRALERLAKRLGVRTVATGDVHAHTHTRALLQDALVAIRHGTTLDESELERRGNHSHVLASPRAMAARFADHPQAVAESLRLAESLQFELMSDLGYRYPGCEDAQAHRTLSEVCERAFELRYPQGHARRPEAAARLREELSIIGSLGLSGFFLLHHDVLELARDVAAEVRGAVGEGGAADGSQPRALLAPGRGRGSSVSSLVCYLTGLSHIDPIEAELAIGRFLHEDIASLPDIDVDFPREVRERLIPRVIERYGPERAALVAAYSTYKPRGAIRELGKALGLPAGEIERVARGSEGHGPAGTVAQDIRAALGPERAGSGRWAWLARLADEICGLPRHLSQHPGGMVIATRPLIDCCPVVPAAMGGRQMIQWDKDSAADAGLLKLDLLSLGMLSAVERCVELIARRRGEAIDLSRIPFDDPATFQAIQEADTAGVFQIESRAQMASLKRTRPECLKDLTIQVALVRPGPIVGGAVNPYIERRQRLASDPGFEVPYLHDSLREPLAETLGTIIFQDQVIEVARAFAGFSTGDAESLRRAMSRKRSEEAVERHHRHFVEGALRTHADVDRELAERVWAMVRGFAGFGFPKAHGAAFGLLAYQSAYLRVHYPGELLCALLNEQPMGFYAPDSLIHDAQRHGVEVRPPDVNRSEAECTLTDEGAIQLGLSYIKGLRRAEIERLLRARSEGGRFQSFEELAARSGLPRAALEKLAWAGACEELAGWEALRSPRRTALWQLGVAGARAMADVQDQLALALPLADAPRLRAPGAWEQLVADYASSSVSVERHPVELLRGALQAQGAMPIAELARIRHGSTVSVGGLVIARQRPATARGVVFLLLEDEQGTINVIVPRPLYERRRTVVRTQPLVLVRGRLERHPAGGGQIDLLARELLALHPLAGRAAPVTSLPARRTSKTHAVGETAKASHAATGTEDFSVVAPPVISFARGRRR